MPRPNIILFHAESWDGRMLGCAGHPALRHATPNIDRLAESGAYFGNAYCSHPICCPSRANMWSGRYTHHCESWNNYKGLEPGMWSLLGELPKTVKNFGKLDYLSGGHSQSARLGAWLATSGINKPNFDTDKSQCFSVDPSDDIRCHECDWKYVDGAVDFLKEHRDEPFFLCISTGLAHAPFRTNRYWLDRIPEAAVDIPGMDNTDHPVRLYQRMTKAWRYGFDESVVRQVRRGGCAGFGGWRIAEAARVCRRVVSGGVRESANLFEYVVVSSTERVGICEVVGCRRECRSEVDRCLGDGNKQ